MVSGASSWRWSGATFDAPRVKAGRENRFEPVEPRLERSLMPFSFSRRAWSSLPRWLILSSSAALRLFCARAVIMALGPPREARRNCSMANWASSSSMPKAEPRVVLNVEARALSRVAGHAHTVASATDGLHGNQLVFEVVAVGSLAGTLGSRVEDNDYDGGQGAGRDGGEGEEGLGDELLKFERSKLDGENEEEEERNGQTDESEEEMGIQLGEGRDSLAEEAEEDDGVNQEENTALAEKEVADQFRAKGPVFHEAEYDVNEGTEKEREEAVDEVGAVLEGGEEVGLLEELLKVSVPEGGEHEERRDKEGE
ncbi:hypothetical protein BC936DRAFT_147853 [Jimgerdemannia flammicorona]|uniref:Uncharacterized protein n=1 Tax=Jimgerdemannia flammicorona TaxID=994334 RepID=A0A433D4I5_9FUNG|nr:hypothetical protein BC936DRAFT_147853 [Jimgerdemannia flammicorona]